MVAARPGLLEELPTAQGDTPVPPGEPGGDPSLGEQGAGVAGLLGAGLPILLMFCPVATDGTWPGRWKTGEGNKLCLHPSSLGQPGLAPLGVSAGDSTSPD